MTIHVAQNQGTYIVRLIDDAGTATSIETFLHAITGQAWRVVIQVADASTVHGLTVETISAILATHLLAVQPSVGSGYDSLSSDLIQTGLSAATTLLSNIVTNYLANRP